MVTSSPHGNLLSSAADIPPTLLPADPATDLLMEGDAVAVAASYPASSLAWSLLASDALGRETRESDVTAYAYARTGYHRGLDALRRAGWRGTGPVPWDHEPNRGFLLSVWALAQAADRLGEADENQRCVQLLKDSSEEAWSELADN